MTENPKPQYAVVLDIDQTLAGGVVETHMAYYNSRLKLGMTPEQVDATASFSKTFDVPEIIAYRERDEDGFQSARAEIRTSHDVHVGFKTLPASLNGVAELLAAGHFFGGYYTVRPPEVESATHEWLQTMGFPNHEQVVICDSPEDKLRKIVDDLIPEDQEEQTAQNVILIDDSYKQLADAAVKMTEENPKLKPRFEKLIIAGYTQNNETSTPEFTLDLRSGIRTISLPSWEKEHVANLIHTLK